MDCNRCKSWIGAPHAGGRSVFMLLAFFFSMSVMPGCTGITFESGDALKTIYSARVNELRGRYADQTRFETAMAGALSDETGVKRNRILNDFIFLIDNNYTFWEKHLYNKKSFADFGSDVMATSLSTLSGIVSGGGVQGAKSILSFVAGGITSTRASFNSDILQSQNLLAIVAKMRAQRAEKRIVLQNGMYKTGTVARPLADYSLDQGLIDLGIYYEAGTFVSALQDIVDKAGKEKSESDKTLKTLQKTPQPKSENKEED